MPDLSLARTLAAGNRHLARVRRDGTVRAEGDDEYGQCDVGAWTDIVSVAVGEVHTVGLRVNGSVTAAGSDAFGQCDVSDWHDVRAIAATSRATVALRNDGTVLCTDTDFAVSDWRQVVAIAAGGPYRRAAQRRHAAFVRLGAFGQCGVENCSDVAAIAAGPYVRSLYMGTDGGAYRLDAGLFAQIPGARLCGRRASLDHAVGLTGRAGARRGKRRARTVRRRSCRICGSSPPRAA